VAFGVPLVFRQLQELARPLLDLDVHVVFEQRDQLDYAFLLIGKADGEFGEASDCPADDEV
jgi:hypothetical protein